MCISQTDQAAIYRCTIVDICYVITLITTEWLEKFLEFKLFICLFRSHGGESTLFWSKRVWQSIGWVWIANGCFLLNTTQQYGRLEIDYIQTKRWIFNPQFQSKLSKKTKYLLIYCVFFFQIIWLKIIAFRKLKCFNIQERFNRLDIQNCPMGLKLK